MTIKANTNDDGTCPNCGQDMRLPSSIARLSDERLDELARSVRNPNRAMVRELLRKVADEAASVARSAIEGKSE